MSVHYALTTIGKNVVRGFRRAYNRKLNQGEAVPAGGGGGGSSQPKRFTLRRLEGPRSEVRTMSAFKLQYITAVAFNLRFLLSSNPAVALLRLSLVPVPTGAPLFPPSRHPLSKLSPKEGFPLRQPTDFSSTASSEESPTLRRPSSEEKPPSSSWPADPPLSWL